jgi:single-strand DNA-binding protein
MNILTLTGACVGEVTEKQVNGEHTLKMFSLVNSIGRGDKKEDVYWNVLIWNTRFDKVIPWIKKGRMLTVVGSLHSKPSFYQKDGEIRANNLQVTAEMLHFLPERKPEEPKQPEGGECPF